MKDSNKDSLEIKISKIDDEEMLEMLASDIIKAIKKDDPKTLAMALCELIDVKGYSSKDKE